ncbi:MAG TPA: nucleotidyltransferase family protein [Pedobacter sp.]|nr:nucleotidyltransferase family protein [Pedobacter sp.]
MSTGIIILSAGNSSRLGNPKQLLYYKGSTLLETTISAAEQTSFAPVVLVLGAYATEILAANPNLNINYIINESWEQGISSSIAAGLTKIIELDPDTQNVIIAVSDQPFISHEIFEALLEKQRSTAKPMIASQYSETIGTPALFNRQYFDPLMSLEGNMGAKHILTENIDEVATVPFELGRIDIDNETDYNNLSK